jgi:hypothetical protein
MLNEVGVVTLIQTQKYSKCGVYPILAVCRPLQHRNGGLVQCDIGRVLHARNTEKLQYRCTITVLTVSTEFSLVVGTLVSPK